LIVEDQTLLLLHLEELLTEQGVEAVATARTGEQAIALAKKHRPDIILMDIALAGILDGIAAARRILAHTKVPIVFHSAHADAQTRACIAALGCELVSKPIDGAKLRSAITRATSSQTTS
jgi:CheY-like chemotaxis protein